MPGRAKTAPIGSPARSDMVGGMVARIHRLPSSSDGRNSLPSLEPRNRLSTRKASPITIVMALFCNDQRRTGV